MKQKVRRALAVSGMAIVIGASGLSLGAGPIGISSAFAAENVKIRSGTSVTKNSLKLPIQDLDLKGAKVKIQVTFVNEKSGKTKTKTFVKTLDSNGDTTVTVKGLTSDTQYTVSVKAKKDKSGASYSDASSTKELKTKS